MSLEALAPETRNLIDGQLVDASNGATFDNINPATEAKIGVCADGTKEDMNAAIAAARRIRFKPALKNGTPITKIIRIQYNFTIY